MYAFNSDGTNVNGWPINLASGIRTSPSIGDINGDGKKEILILKNNPTEVYAYDLNGRLLSGWPKTFGLNTRYIQDFLSVGDLDNDGKDDIVLFGDENSKAVIYIVSNSEYVKGTIGSVQNVPYFVSPIIGDINGDGKKEIIISTNEFNSGVYTQYVSIVNSSANVINKFSTGYSTSIQGKFVYNI